MKNFFEHLKKLISEHHLSFSGGTVFFLFFNLLLIAGFCKFSFYVLKNHRSAVERDSLIKTYVDVQPYMADKKNASSYVSLASRDKTAPAPFFVRKEETETPRFAESSEETAPQPVLTASAKPSDFPVVAQTTRRPPVIRPAVHNPVGSSESVAAKEIIPDNEPAAITPAVSLDTLMASGLDLLDQSEETVITAAEHFLPEETSVSPAVPESAPADVSVAVREEAPVVEKAEPPVAKKAETPVAKPAGKTAAEKKSPKATRWVDVAELRRRLADELLKKDEKTPSAKKSDVASENAALLKMNDAKQVAALERDNVSDTAESSSVRKNESEKPPSETAPVTAVADVKTEKASEAEKTVRPETTQVAVVQDIPFSESVSSSETVKKNESVPASAPARKNRALAGNSSDLWKIAKIRGTPKMSAGKPQSALPEKEIKEKSETAFEQTLPSEKPDMIYRNGKAVAAVRQQEKKPLNWLDRQEAAVWTSMSQSDTPSVWSADTETEKTSPEKARAFRVAGELPAISAKSEENNPSVRAVNASPSPEAKENPVLLPLGSPTPSFTPVSGKSKEAQSEEGLMDKLFSFFGKTDAPEGSPAASPAETVKTEQTPVKTSAFPVGEVTVGNKFNADSDPFGLKTKTEEKSFVPTEMRLTFKPDSTEMSVQSIKWIKALGQKAKKDIQNAIEVRMSTVDPELQDKRFAIIRNTLLGVGVEEVQILPVSTDRTPHSIVLRMIVLPEEGYTEYTTESNGIKERLYYKQW